MQQFWGDGVGFPLTPGICLPGNAENSCVGLVAPVWVDLDATGDAAKWLSTECCWNCRPQVAPCGLCVSLRHCRTVYLGDS